MLAREHRDAGRFEEAVGEYEAAYKEDPDPDYLFQIGYVLYKVWQRDQRSVDRDQAETALQAFRRKAAENAPQRKPADEMLREIGVDRSAQALSARPKPEHVSPQLVAEPARPSGSARGWPLVALAAIPVGVGGAFWARAEGNKINDGRCTSTSDCADKRSAVDRWNYLVAVGWVVAATGAAVGAWVLLSGMTVGPAPAGTGAMATTRWRF
jgi:tetratricopeptide (TPR) repeat protein